MTDNILEKIFPPWTGLGSDFVSDVLTGIRLAAGEKKKMHTSNDDKKDNFLK